MTRVKISLCLMLAMVCVSVFSGIWVNERCTSLSEQAEKVCAAFEKGDSEKAAAEAEQLERQWEGVRAKAAVLLKYDKLYEIDRIAARAPYLAIQRSDELLPQMSELIHMLAILKENEKPFWNSVL